MKIRKKEPSIGILGKIVNSFTSSKQDTYSADYINTALEEHYSTEETFTGKYWIDGKKIYKKVILSTVGNINSILGSLNIEHTINLFGKANSNYEQKWSIPNTYHLEPKYNNTVTYKGEIPEINFYEFYRETDAVEVIIEYTKTTE